MSLFMGIDAGTSGIKVIIMDAKGAIHGTGYHECDLITPQPGWAEQNPEDWWVACDYAVTQAVQMSGCGTDVAGIGLSGQQQGSALLDRDMRPIGNCMIWLDQRATKEAEEISAMEFAPTMLNITANHCLNSFWAPKLLWLRKHDPASFDRIHKTLFTKDYLCYRMTGEVGTEVSDAALTYLMDTGERKWSDYMFEKLGIPRHIVPDRLLESQDVAGFLSRKVAEKWGLRPNIPVVAGGGDQPAGGVGTGIVRSGVIGSAIGTSGVVFGCTDAPLVDRKARAIISMAHSVPEKWCFLGLVLMAGGSFKWLRESVFADKKRQMATEGKDVYDYMTALAENASAGSEGLTFLPYLNGEKTPINDENARGVFFGLSNRHGLPELCRSVMEGVTFALRDTIEICRELGFEINEVRASGGGAKSRLWRQIQADVYNTNVVYMNMEEGPAAGAAIMAAVGAGEFSSIPEACDEIVKVESVLHPNRENVKRYDEYYRTYRALYPALKNLYLQRAENVQKYI